MNLIVHVFGIIQQNRQQIIDKMTSIDNLLIEPNQMSFERCLKTEDNIGLSIINHLEPSTPSVTQLVFKEAVSDVIEILYQEKEDREKEKEMELKLKQANQELQTVKDQLNQLGKKYDTLYSQNLQLKGELEVKTNSLATLQNLSEMLKEQIGRVLTQNKVLYQEKQAEMRKLNSKISSYDESSERINRSMRCYSKFIATMIEQNNKLREENIQIASNLTQRALTTNEHSAPPRSRTNHSHSAFKKLKLNFPIQEQQQNIPLLSEKTPIKSKTESQSNQPSDMALKQNLFNTPFKKKNRYIK